MSRNIFKDSNFPRKEATLYFASAASRFPSAILAVEQLKKIGRPPSKTTPVSTQRMQNVCQILAAITRHRESPTPPTLIHWESIIGPWVIFFLQQVLLIPDHFSKPEWADVAEQLLLVIPPLLELPENTLATLKRAFSSLQPFTTQVFLLVLDKNYWWGGWAKTVKDLALCDYYDDTLPSLAIGSDPQISHLYPLDSRLGGILIRTLDSQISVLRMTPNKDLEDFKILILIIRLAPQCFQGVDPMALGENRPRILRLMIRILNILLRKQKSLRLQPVGSTEWQSTCNLAADILNHIKTLLITPTLIQEALDSGILKILFYADDRFYEAEKLETRDSIGRTKVSTPIVDILETMSVLFVYPSVLRSFARAARKFSSPEEAIKRFSAGDFEALGTAWGNTLLQFSLLNDVRHTMETVGGRCYNVLTGTMNTAGNALIYLDDSKVSQYQHPSTPIELTRHSAGSDLPITSNDWRLTRLLIQGGLGTDGENFNNIIENYRRTMFERVITSPRDRSIRDGARNPILYLDYTKPLLPDSVPPKAMDRETFATMLRTKEGWRGWEYNASVLKKWEDSNESTLLVFARFARGKETYYPQHILVEYPLKGPPQK
ncbi:hypothetical protein AAF712_012472 [Marasmius tenuissimus]|uniref:Uncharacterized protein n=1 Tax=Marasmius tenuissimus TaxID=585030 RepID=A0ABR2ZHP0_9AGAR